MGKSIRSKSKRSFRAKKREDGVYAAIEAARLQRGSAKLRAVQEADKDGDVVINEEESGDITPGSFWFLLFGLIEPFDVDFESLDGIGGIMTSHITDAY